MFYQLLSPSHSVRHCISSVSYCIVRLRLLTILSADEVQFPAKTPVFTVSSSKGLSLCFMCSDQHLKYWRLVGFPWLAVCYSITTLNNTSSASYCISSVSYCIFSASYCIFSASYCIFSASYCIFSASYCIFSASYCISSASYYISSASYCIFSVSYCISSASYCIFSVSYCISSASYSLLPTRVSLAYYIVS